MRSISWPNGLSGFDGRSLDPRALVKAQVMVEQLPDVAGLPDEQYRRFVWLIAAAYDKGARDALGDVNAALRRVSDASTWGAG